MSKNLDPIHNLPREIFDLVLNQISPSHLQDICLVTPHWYDAISSTSRFLDGHKKCRLEMLLESKYSSLDGVDPSKFNKLRVTSQKLVRNHVSFWDCEDPTDSKVLSIDHINQMTKFSPYITHLELHDLAMNEDVLIALLLFLNECSELRCLEFSYLTHEKLTGDLSDCYFELGMLDYVNIVDSFWILKHLVSPEIKKLAVLGKDEKSDSLEFKVNFKWREFRINLHNINHDVANQRNIKLLIDAAEICMLAVHMELQLS